MIQNEKKVLHGKSQESVVIRITDIISGFLWAPASKKDLIVEGKIIETKEFII